MKRYEYKVARFLTGRNAEDEERWLNELGREGWLIVGAATQMLAERQYNFVRELPAA